MKIFYFSSSAFLLTVLLSSFGCQADETENVQDISVETDTTEDTEVDIPEHEEVCSGFGEECDSDSDCCDNRCFYISGEQSVCTRNCPSDADDCPENWMCVLNRDSGAGDTYWCGPCPEEICDGEDNDCDGYVDEELNIPCYSGLNSTEGVGICQAGTQACSGGQWEEECVGEVTPEEEEEGVNCADGLDNDCDGQADEEDEDCGGTWCRSFGDDQQQDWSHLAVDSEGNVVVAGGLKGTINFGSEENGCTADEGTIDIFLAKLNASGNVMWTRCFPNRGSEWIYDVAIDSTDNIVITGRFTDELDLGMPQEIQEEQAFFLTKFNPMGEHTWTRIIGDIQYSHGHAVTIDKRNDSVIVTAERRLHAGGGNFTSLMKYTSSGDHYWTNTYGNGEGSWIEGRDVIVASSGDILFSGDLEGTIDFEGSCGVHNATVPSAFVAKFDVRGNCLWSSFFTTTSGGNITTNSDYVYVFGGFIGSLETEGCTAIEGS